VLLNDWNRLVITIAVKRKGFLICRCWGAAYWKRPRYGSMTIWLLTYLHRPPDIMAARSIRDTRWSHWSPRSQTPNTQPRQSARPTNHPNWLLKMHSFFTFNRQSLRGTQRSNLTSTNHPGFSPNYVQKFLNLVTFGNNCYPSRECAECQAAFASTTTAQLRGRMRRSFPYRREREAHKLTAVAPTA